MKNITFLVLALLVAACSAGGSELSRDRQKWQDANITHYRFSLIIGCECMFAGQLPATVEVQNGEVVSIIGSDGNPISMTDPMNVLIVRYATIDRLFSELESDAVKEAYKLTVTYDSAYGFPAEINIDFIESAVDDELRLSASAFEPLP